MLQIKVDYIFIVVNMCIISNRVKTTNILNSYYFIIWLKELWSTIVWSISTVLFKRCFQQGQMLATDLQVPLIHYWLINYCSIHSSVECGMTKYSLGHLWWIVEKPKGCFLRHSIYLEKPGYCCSPVYQEKP